MMDRLTDGRKTVSMCISSDECFRYNRLAAYEDNGQTPEEQAEMIAENARLREELEATVRQITSTRACKMCVHREHAPIDGPCETCNRAYKPHFEWARPCAENGGAE